MSTRLDYYDDFMKQVIGMGCAYSQFSNMISTMCINEVLKSTKDISKLAGRELWGSAASTALWSSK